MVSPDNSLSQQRFTPSPRRLMVMAALLLAVTICAVLLYLFNPADNGFYPQCVFHKVTGWDCPGCGSQRALHQLIHGHLAKAFQFNPLLVLLLPFALWMGLREILSLATGKKLPGLPMRSSWGWGLLVVIVLFGIGRNLPIFGAGHG